jgi:hypothetical protein
LEVVRKVVKNVVQLLFGFVRMSRELVRPPSAWDSAAAAAERVPITLVCRNSPASIGAPPDKVVGNILLVARF